MSERSARRWVRSRAVLCTMCVVSGVCVQGLIWQKEEEGVMTVKFKDAVSAEACVQKMNGRFFDGRKVGSTLLACDRAVQSI